MPLNTYKNSRVYSIRRLLLYYSIYVIKALKAV